MPALSQDQSDYLRGIYFNPKSPASYQSPLKLYRFVKKQGQYTLSHRQINKWLERQESYTLNKSVVRNFQRRRVLVTGIDDQWEADLASLGAYSAENDNYKYLLCVIDVFSRFAWVKPLKTKFAREIIPAFQNILNQGRKPKRLRTDAATDFTSNSFQNLMEQSNINHFTTHNEKQANYVERFIQTIKRKILKHIVSTNNKRYIDSLQLFVDSYNGTFHSGIQMEPSSVTAANETKLWWQMYWPRKNEKAVEMGKKVKTFKGVRFKIDVGDMVRITYRKEALAREYDTRWSIEIFKVAERFIRQRTPMYKLNDWSNEPVKGTFYENEIQKTSEPPIWKIDEVLKYKGRGRNKQVLVSWKGWPKKFNEWIPETNIEQL